MSISMEIPNQFLSRINSGSASRIGRRICATATGRTFGHLKEVGTQSGAALAGILGSAGAIASVAGLGVSVAGFTLVMNRLNRLEHNVMRGMEEIRAAVGQLQGKLEMLDMARIKTAAEQLMDGRHGSNPRHRAKLQLADATFQVYRNYYSVLISNIRPLQNLGIALPAGRSLLGRFLVCAQAELEINLLLEDYEQWHARHARIKLQVAELFAFEPRKEFRERAGTIELLSRRDLTQLRDEIAFTHEFCRESQARIETADSEVKWLQIRRIARRIKFAAFNLDKTYRSWL